MFETQTASSSSDLMSEEGSRSLEIDAHKCGANPDNSLFSIRRVAEQGIQNVEVDVYHSLDGELVCMHGGAYGNVEVVIPGLDNSPDLTID